MSSVKEQIRTLKSQPRSIDQLVELGKLYHQQGDLLESQHYFREATQLDPNDSRPYFLMGELLLEDENSLTHASDFFGKAVLHNPKSAENWLGYAKTHYKLGAFTRAEDYIEKAMALSPDNHEILFYVGVIKYNLHKFYHAEKYLLQAVEDKDHVAYAYSKFYLGVLYGKMGLYFKALNHFRDIENLRIFKKLHCENGIAIRNNMALVEFRMGNFEKAETIIANLIKKTPGVDAAVYVNYAQILWKQGKIQAAVEQYVIAHKINGKAWPWISELKEYLETGQEGMKAKIESLAEDSKDGYNISLYLGCVIPNRYPFIESSTRHVLHELNIGVKDLEGASCCPAPGVFRSFDIATWETVAARNITLSEELGRDMVTMCNGCYGTLNDVNTELKENKLKAAEVNKHLHEINREYKGSQDVRHLIGVLYYTVGLDKIRSKIVNPFKDLNVAVHYGCHLLKPSHNKPWADSTEDPHFFDELVEITGAKSVPYKDKLMCCGAGGAVRGGVKEVSLDFTREKLENMRAAGIDAIVLCCPFCHLQFDLGQVEVNNIFKDKIEEPFDFPVIYYSQLLGLAMGMDPYRMGLLKNPPPKGTPPFTSIEPFFTKLIDKTDL